MALGGPASFGSGFLRSFLQTQQRAQTRNREQLNEALRLQKDMRENQEAIAKENLNRQKAEAEAALAKNELDLVEQRRAQIMALPGGAFKDAALEGHLEEAKERLEDAHVRVQESRAKLQDLTAARDARIRGAISGKVPGTGLRGVLGIGSPERDMTRGEREEAFLSGIAEDTPENKEFAKSSKDIQKEIGTERDLESREKAKVGGYEKAIESGQPEKRAAALFPLDEKAAELRAKQLEDQFGMAAAAQEIQARQREQQFLQQQMPRYGGGPATGKGGGRGGPLGGLAGAITGKSGGMGSAGAQGQPGASPAPAGGVPTVGQAIGPVIGRIAQMPVPQAAQIARTVLGEVIGGGRRQPAFGGPGPNSVASSPVRVPGPAVGLQGQGGGPPEVQEFAGNVPNQFRGGLQQSGFTPIATAGILGNAAQESRFNPAEVGDRGTSYGLLQERGPRRENLFSFSGSRSPSPEQQAKFAAREARGISIPGGGNLFDAMNQARTPGEAALLWSNRFERPNARLANNPNRIAQAQRFATQTAAPAQSIPRPPARPAAHLASPSPSGGIRQEQGTQRGPAPARQQAAPPPVPQSKAAALPEIMEMSAPPQQQQQQPPPQQSEHPLIHDERHLQSLKPGSLWRSPDGKLRIVPLPAMQSEAGT